MTMTEQPRNQEYTDISIARNALSSRGCTRDGGEHVDTLVRSGTKEDYTLLAQVAGKGSGPKGELSDVIMKAADVLAKHGTQESDALVAGLLTKDFGWQGNHYALISSLSQRAALSPSDGGVVGLLEFGFEQGNATVRRFIVQESCRKGLPSRFGFVSKGLFDSDRDVRDTALNYIRKDQMLTQSDQLIEVCKSIALGQYQTSSDVRCAVIEELGEISKLSGVSTTLQKIAQSGVSPYDKVAEGALTGQ